MSLHDQNIIHTLSKVQTQVPLGVCHYNERFRNKVTSTSSFHPTLATLSSPASSSSCLPQPYLPWIASSPSCDLIHHSIVPCSVSSCDGACMPRSLFYVICHDITPVYALKNLSSAALIVQTILVRKALIMAKQNH